MIVFAYKVKKSEVYGEKKTKERETKREKRDRYGYGAPRAPRFARS